MARPEHMIAVGDRIAVAYDAIATEYEVQLERNPVAAYMRRRLHRHFAATFRPGDCVLDLTAGTGLDALFLAGQGIQVSALDVSSRMIAELQQNAAKSGLHIEARVLAAEQMDGPEGYYAGAISTFAGLNTIQDMPALAQSLAHSLRPHGRVILHGLNEFCLWQAAANLLRRRAERDGVLRVGGASVQHRLYSPFALWRQAFAPYFQVRQAYALSVVAAPPFIKRFPQTAPLVFQVDQLLGWAFPSSGDFFVLDLERRW